MSYATGGIELSRGDGETSGAVLCIDAYSYRCGCCSCVSEFGALHLVPSMAPPAAVFSWEFHARGGTTNGMASTASGNALGSTFDVWGGFEIAWLERTGLDPFLRVRPSAEEPPGFAGDGWIAAAGTDALVAWVESTPSVGPYDGGLAVLYAQRHDGPASASPPSLRIAGGRGAPRYPGVAWSGTAACLAWLDGRGDAATLQVAVVPAL
jgi:hypothetical protein